MAVPVGHAGEDIKDIILDTQLFKNVAILTVLSCIGKFIK
jgi:hypothetical protein